MKLLEFFRRNPGRELALIQHRSHRQHVRSVVDEMRDRMGLPKVEWPK